MLHRLGTDSKVGKGSETVLDKKVRSSKEYTGDGVYWDQQFSLLVKDHVTKLLAKMNAGELVAIKPYKIVVYGKGDFFSEHMDSTHTPGQTMTAVVELCTDFEDGELMVDGKDMSGSGEQVKLMVFDHDLKHNVEEVTNGYRISITYDLVVDSVTPVPSVEEKVMSSVVDRLKALGVKRCGFFCTQRYFEDQKLKGADARVVEAFKPLVSKIEEHDLSTDDCRNWYHPNVWNAKNSGPECGSLMYEVESYTDDEEYPEEETYHGEDYDAPSKPTTKSFPGVWSPSTDNSEVFREEYCLGDVFVMWSPHTPKHSMKGNDEIHLGNEGFYGDVHENRFVVMTLKQNLNIDDEQRCGRCGGDAEGGCCSQAPPWQHQPLTMDAHTLRLYGKFNEYSVDCSDC
jgi:hypothetical protein